MQVGQFPASAANSLIQGYCDDFVSLAAILAQTLEQISMRGLNFDGSRPALQRIENGMRNLADAIHELIERGKVTSDLSVSLGKDAAAPAPAAANRTSHAAANRAAAPAPAPYANAPRAAATAPPPSHGARAPVTNTSRNTPAGPASNRASQPTAASQPPAPANGSPARPAPPKPQSLRGTNASMPLLSVFQFLGRMRKAGMMRVQLGEETLTFELSNGCVLSTTSSQCPQQERLGELLVELGSCTREAIAAIVNRVDAGASERFGQLAIENGVVTDHQVVAALELQVNVRFDRACKAASANYEFVEGVRRSAESTFRIQPFAIA